MFSPIGRKKLLLQIQRYPEKREELLATLKPPPNSELKRPETPKVDITMASRPVTPLVNLVGAGNTSTRNLEFILEEMTPLGDVARKITEVAVRYRRERDASALIVFNTNSLTYEEFREHLKRSFRLNFSDEEFRYVIKLFDNDGDRTIDGSEFLVCFTKLASIYKAKHAAEIREKQLQFEIRQREEAERKQRELHKKNELAVDYKFTTIIREEAIKKMSIAAKKYDKNHPSAVSLDGFDGSSLTPGEFREILRRTFNLHLTPQELGALVKEFDKDGDGHISCNEFLLTFFKLGFQGRSVETVEQLERQRMMTREAEAKEKEKLEALGKKMELKVDYNFSEADEATMHAKLVEASKRYDKNHPSSVAPDGFDVLYMTAGVFREMLKRTFNLHLTGKELGCCVRTFDKTGKGQVVCKDFLLRFFQLGHDERNKQRLEQMIKQREMCRAAEEEAHNKLIELRDKSSLKLVQKASFTDDERMAIMDKIRVAAAKYDKTQASAMGLEGFDPKYLTPGVFKEMLKRTFNFTVSADELALLMDMYKYQNDVTKLDCEEFIKMFLMTGIEERNKVTQDNIEKQRIAERAYQVETENAIKEKEKKRKLAEVDFGYSDEDRTSVMSKMGAAASKYNKNHPSAVSLDAFNVKYMDPTSLKDILVRAFHLQVTPKELGAIVHMFDSDHVGQVVCYDFLRYFFKLGFTERSKFYKESLIKQREAERARQMEHEEKIKHADAKREMKVDFSFTDADLDAVVETITEAAAKYDRNHPSAVALDGFESAHLTPGEFREVVQRTFRITITPKGLASLLTFFNADKEGNINTTEFLTKFFQIGKARRDKAHKESVEKQRKLLAIAKKEEEDKLTAQLQRCEERVRVDWEYTLDDEQSAIEKLVKAAQLYDRTSVSAPSMDAFVANYIGPGQFRELIKRTFNLRVTDKELGALVMRFQHPDQARHVDCRMFEINFIQIGINERRKAAVAQAQLQKQLIRDEEIKSDMKRKKMESKSDLKINHDYSDVEKKKSIVKLTNAAFKYDKTMPSSCSITAFDAECLTPGQFREVLRRTFNLKFTPQEFGALVDMFDKQKTGRIESKPFLDEFCRIGIAERDKMRLLQIEKNRVAIKMQKQEQIRKVLDAERKMELEVREEFTEEEQRSAFQKITVAATKYDKNHPSAVSLEGFDALTLTYGQFRELVKRTFGVVLNEGELSAVVDYFDPKKKGCIVSKEFLIYFSKLGITERDKFATEDLRKKRQNALEREREEKEKLEAQWAKMELELDMSFSDSDMTSAMKKFTDAATLYDPSHSSAMDLSALDVVSMTPAVFREMLKRILNIRLTGKELGAMVTLFNNGENLVDCPKFLIKFAQTGYDERDKAKKYHKKKKEQFERSIKEERERKEKEQQNKVAEDFVDWDFGHADFTSSLQKVKNAAAAYDKNHPSAVGLDGFQGASLYPMEFREVLKRTFGIILSSKELGAIVKFFDSDGDGTIDTSEFLKHFYKLQRVERSSIRRKRIVAERSVADKLKAEVDDRIKKKANEEQALMSFTDSDVESLMKKLKYQAQIFAVDSSSFVGPLQALKGPALPPIAFKEVYYRIFQQKLTYPEIGALMSVIDDSGTGSIDGKKFCNAFFRLGRLEEKLMMGEITEPITINSMKSQSVESSLLESSPTSAKKTRSPEKNAWSASQSVDLEASKELKNASTHTSSHELDRFSDITIGKSWVLPSSVRPKIEDTKQSTPKTRDSSTSAFPENSFDDFEPFIMVSRPPGSRNAYRPNYQEFPMPDTGKPVLKANISHDKRPTSRGRSPSPTNHAYRPDSHKGGVKHEKPKTNIKFEDIKIRPLNVSKSKSTSELIGSSTISTQQSTSADGSRLVATADSSVPTKPKRIKKVASEKKPAGIFFFPALLSNAPTISLNPVGQELIEQETYSLYHDTSTF